jgi:hypothetical protein
MSNKYIREQLINMYGETCFLGGKPSAANPLTLHHIKPVCNGGVDTVKNGALLTESMHWLFNMIESCDPDVAEHINKYFQYYKNTRDEDARMKMSRFVLKYYTRKMKKHSKKKGTFQKKVLTNI